MMTLIKIKSEAAQHRENIHRPQSAQLSERQLHKNIITFMSRFFKGC